MSATAAMIQEFEQESATTRRVLERVPTEKLAWKPHDKSMSLGALAVHVAQVPGFITDWAVQDSVTASGGSHPEPKSTAEILAIHDASVSKAKANMSAVGDANLGKMWEFKTPDGHTIMKMPKGALLRSVALNHWYHHRGQLSVYLRLLNVPVPSIYGPSADEQPAR
ncbi:MAG TPA: DinB family protein [Vicinamibacterales bacterium]|nr:DinB family protein [Vicinamibacterales bacterium]